MRAKGLVKAILKRTPGARSLDRRLYVHYLARIQRDFASPFHFCSPTPHLPEILERADVIFRKDVDVGKSIDLRRESQRKLLEELVPFAAEFTAPTQPDPSRRFHLNPTFYPLGDAAVLEAMLRRLRPRRVVEIGSGFTSALMLDVDETKLDGATEFTFIDPDTSRLDLLLRDADRRGRRVLAKRVQDVPLETFEALDAGDWLFVDSSHTAKVGSDVNHVFFEILPRLASGVVVHFHDVHWPFEYPLDWIRQGIAWNEAYLLRAFLQYNRAFELVFFTSQVCRERRDWIASRAPTLLSDPPATSCWIRKV